MARKVNTATISLHAGSVPTIEPVPPTPAILDADAYDDLMQQLELNLNQIADQYSSFINSVRKSVLGKGITAEEFCAYLLSLRAFKSGHTKQEIALLADVKDHLRKATTINEIFNVLNTEYEGHTFMNCDIFKHITKEYGIEQEYAEYLKHLDAYIQMHKLSEFEEINPKLKEVKSNSKKMTLKFDIENTCTLARLQV
jgi:hypothetical protein